MALGTPNLDQITTPLDSIVGSLDSTSDLDKVEFSSPTLEQLDTWGLMDALDTFGNLDALSSLAVKQGAASVSTSATVTAELQFAIEVDATVSTSATVSAAATRVRTMDATVASVGTVTATATATKIPVGSATVSATATASAIPVRQMVATADTAATVNDVVANLVFLVTASEST